MKNIIIKGEEFQYELVSFGTFKFKGLISETYTHLGYKTKFYKGYNITKSKKGFIFKKMIENKSPIFAFEMQENIEDYNFSKDEIKTKIERAYSIWKGDII